jgi:hypothetical protein
MPVAQCVDFITLVGNVTHDCVMTIPHYISLTKELKKKAVDRPKMREVTVSRAP